MYAADAARRRRRQGLIRLGLAAGALVAVLAGLWLVLGGAGDGPDDVAESFLERFEAGDFTAAAALTDGPQQRVSEALKANVEGLDGASLDAEVESVTETRDGEAMATFEMTWEIPEIGTYSYNNDTIRLRSQDGDWRVRWRESVVHPALDEEGYRLGTQVDPAERAPILGRDGRALVRLRPVFEVGVIPRRLEDVDSAARAIGALTEADPAAIASSVEAAEPSSFVPAITLRAEDYAEIDEELDRIEGVEVGERELPLAPTKEFARALLGAVGPATAEQLQENPDLEEGQLIGQWGLQAAFDDQLAGESAREVVVRMEGGTFVETLESFGGERGSAVKTTLDREVQLAAEAALGGLNGKAALTAVDAGTGDILAVANRPLEDTFNRAMEGQYPPGSTFKVVTTAALLDAGLSPDETVDCPQYATVGGRQFRNFEGSAAGAVPFSVDFAESCNTAFVSLVGRLAADSLKAAGLEFGIGREFELGVPAYGGSIPEMPATVDRAASMIGQGEILASPLGMAGVAAAVADGRWRHPRLLAEDPKEAGAPLPETQVATLRTLMRSVVTSGTGTALASVPGEPIGKSGTAEYGSGDPPPTHAWFIAVRNGIAISVLLEDKRSGGEYAAPVAARFFQALDSTAGG